MPTDDSPDVYSYFRFSSPEQMGGDSLRRQTAAAEAYCDRRGWRLNSTLTLRDLGVSAFRGQNRLTGNLGVFLAAVKKGTVRPGSVLIIESFDRLSRQGIDEGYDLVKSILKAGIKIVTLSPEREFDQDAVKSLSRGSLEIQIILERAAEDSEIRSKRIGSAWKAKREALYAGKPQPISRGDRVGGTNILTRKLPAWVKEQDGRLELIPDRAEVVRRVFALSAAGAGSAAIVARMTDEKVPPIGRGAHWSRAYVSLLLKDRRALGEFRPVKGAPVPDYFPAAVTVAEFEAAAKASRYRRQNPGQAVAKHVNVFAGFVRSALDGSSYYLVTRTERRGAVAHRNAVLANVDGAEGRGTTRSFPYQPFEEKVLDCLAEVDARDVVGPGGAAAGGAAGVAAELADLDDRIALLEQELASGDVPSIARALRVLEDRRRELLALLAEARAGDRVPVAEAVGEVRGLVGLLRAAADPDDVRRRIRTAMKSAVESIRLLVVPRGAVTLAAVQIRFVGSGATREIVLYHRRAVANARAAAPAVSEVMTVRLPPAADLRVPDHARRLERALAAVELSEKKGDQA